MCIDYIFHLRYYFSYHLFTKFTWLFYTKWDQENRKVNSKAPQKNTYSYNSVLILFIAYTVYITIQFTENANVCANIFSLQISCDCSSFWWIKKKTGGSLSTCFIFIVYEMFTYYIFNLKSNVIYSPNVLQLKVISKQLKLSLFWLLLFIFILLSWE